jgi:hypothetical protein
LADDLVDHFDVGKKKTRVALLKYSSSFAVHSQFELDR